VLLKTELELFSSAIIYRDEANNRISRKEVINLIMEMLLCYNFTMAESHLNYLIKKEKIKCLKHNGHMVKAQAMMTKHSQTHKEQQLWWNTTLEEALAKQQYLNQLAEEF
jgi:hypothetical protein